MLGQRRAFQEVFDWKTYGVYDLLLLAKKNSQGLIGGGAVGSERIIRSGMELEGLERQIAGTAKKTIRALRERLSKAEPLQALAEMKFDRCGCHPTEGRPLNLVEQINQTFSCLASVRAAKWLLENHPGAVPFRLNLGTTKGTDIVSLDGTIAAETFAAVDPKNNRKLEKDTAKVSKTGAEHKYVFYICPKKANSQSPNSRQHEKVKVIHLEWNK